MMTLEALRQALPDFAKDIKLNLGSILTDTGAEGLSPNQRLGVALASAYATQNRQLIAAVQEEAASVLSEKETEAAKAAATIMAMNNVYYRFTHAVESKEYASLPPKLRMNIMINHGIFPADFELYSLAVSAINGCGMCMDAHTRKVESEGFPKVGVQSAIRIAAIIHAAAQALSIQHQA